MINRLPKLARATPDGRKANEQTVLRGADGRVELDERAVDGEGVKQDGTVGSGLFLTIFSEATQRLMDAIERIGKDVLPQLKPIWDDEGWENHWWPENASPNRPSKNEAAASAG